jgi:hypothetical protein
MLLTEEEAKEKGCCQPLNFEECNLGPVSCAGKCIASVCMAWRWDENGLWGESYPKEKWVGWCGLAGKPREIS